MYGYSAGIMAVSLIGVMIVSQDLLPLLWSFAISMILIGILFDLLRAAYFRFHYRRYPEGMAEWLLEMMRESVRKRDDALYTLSFEIVFTLIISYMKSGRLAALRLFTSKILTAPELWLGAIVKISLYRVSLEHEESLLDRYSLAEARTAKRLAWVIKEACDMGNPTALEEAVRVAARLFLTFHSCHPSLGFFILVTMSQTGQKSEGKLDMGDIDSELTSAFSEIVKCLIDRSIERGVADTASITKVLAILETHVKESYRRERTANPAFFMQPFAEVGQMLAAPRYNALPDRDEIISHLRRILSQFAALETVTGHLEVPSEGTDTTASFREDLPFTAPPS